MKFNRKQGFTIGELLVAVAVLGILAAGAFITYDGVTGATKQKQGLDNAGALTKAIFNFQSAGGRLVTAGEDAGHATLDGALNIESVASVLNVDANGAPRDTGVGLTSGVWAGGIRHSFVVNGMKVNEYSLVPYGVGVRVNYIGE